MTDAEFADAVRHQTQILEQIQCLLRDNAMSLEADPADGRIYLNDDGRKIGHTGFSLDV